MRSPFVVSLALLGALSVGLAPRVAWADPVADAKDLFSRGRELRGRGDCAGAVALFRKAYALYPAGLGSLRNIAECEEQIGHYASSRRAWLDLKRALITENDPKYAGWSQDAEQAAARLEPKLASLTVDVSARTPGGEAAPLEGVEVTLDGEKLPAELLGTPLERDPGRHVVRAAGPGVPSPQQREVDLTAGATKRVSLAVVVTPPPAGSAAAGAAGAAAGPAPGGVNEGGGAPPREPTGEPTGAPSSKRTFAWIAIGVGAASLVGAGVSLAVRQSALDDLNGGCPTHEGCSPALEPAVGRGQTASTLVTVFTAVGAVGLTGGLVLLATSFGHDGQAALVLQPGLGGVAARGSF